MVQSEALNLTGGRVIITGAASGIGRALAEHLAERGVALGLADIDGDMLAELAQALAATGIDVLHRQVDVSDAAQVETFAKDIFADPVRPVPLVFANAGIHGLTPAIGGDLEVWSRVVGVNLMGAVHSANAFLPRLIARGAPAQLVLTGSQASFLAAPGMAPYIATKHALWGLADTLRQELEAMGSMVGVSLVAPSRTESAITLPRIEIARESGGDQAAADYAALLVPAAKVAETMLREALLRRFWIVPANDRIDDRLRARIDELLDALPAGFIGSD